MRWLQALGVLAFYVWAMFGLFMLGFVITHWPSEAKGAEVFQIQKGDLDLLGRVIWAEARSEPWEGQCAIAWVILNRLAREPGRFPDSLRGVVLQPFAFSCFNSNDPQCAKVKSVDERDPTFVEAMRVAASVLAGKVANPIGRADHYYLTAMKNPPGWARRMSLVKRIGGHSFFSEKPTN